MARRKRQLDAEDLALWKRVAETVAPLKARPAGRKVEIAGKTDEQAAKKGDGTGDTSSRDDLFRVEPMAGATAAPYARPAAPPATTFQAAKTQPLPLDRKLKRRLDRGQRRAEAVIDLHGLTQRIAHDRLLGFLRSSRAQGLRVVLVVTGKGREPVRDHRDWWDAPAGILRRTVPHWLETPPFRELVSAYESPVHRKGGEGALYIQIRRRRGAGD